MSGPVAHPNRAVARLCAVTAAVLAILMAAADASLAGHDLLPLAAAAFATPLAVWAAYRLWARAGWFARFVAVLALAILLMYLSAQLIPWSLAQLMIDVPYHSTAVISGGRLTVTEQITVDRSLIGRIAESVARSGQPAAGVTATTAILSTEWIPDGSVDGDPLYQRVRVSQVGSPPTMHTIRIPVGNGSIDGLGQMRFSGVADMWTMRPRPGSTMDIQVPHGALQATYPPYRSVADTLDGRTDEVTVPIAGTDGVTVNLFGSLLNNPFGRAAYRVYQQNVFFWLVGFLFLALGAVLTDRLKLLIEHGWNRTVRLVRGAGPGRSPPAGPPALVVVDQQRRVRRRPTERHFPGGDPPPG